MPDKRDDELKLIDRVIKTLKELPDWRSRQRAMQYVAERLQQEELDNRGATPGVPASEA